MSALLLLLVVACGADASSSRDNSDVGAFEDRAWVLDAEASGVELAEGEAVSFLFDEGQLEGVNVCNTVEGTYSIRGATIRLGQLLSTAAGCRTEQLSSDVYALLGESITFDVSGHVLTLEGSGNQLRLVFVEIPPEPAVDQDALAGSWRVHPVGDGPPAAPALTFAADGSYEITVGCVYEVGNWFIDRGRIERHRGEGRFDDFDDICNFDEEPYEPYERSSDEVLVPAALGGSFLRPIDDDLEVLDRTGAPIAVLRPSIAE